MERERIWPRICEVYASAQEAGAATTTNTTVELWKEPAGEVQVEWVLRLASFLKKKPTGLPPPQNEDTSKEAEKQKPLNPFDPPEEALTVGHLSDTHTLVLNKFNVVPHHSIVVTRGFQPQTDPLNAKDLEAVYSVLEAMPEGGLGFFNCGEHSGRSQPHKHVQVEDHHLFPRPSPAAPHFLLLVLGDPQLNCMHPLGFPCSVDPSSPSRKR